VCTCQLCLNILCVVLQPSMLPAGKRGGLMREAAQADGVAGGGSRTLVQARIEEWDEQHPFPAARVRTAAPPKRRTAWFPCILNASTSQR
jgi:hypothetical protein